MKLVRAEIRRMPGMPQGYTLESLKGVVLLLGPNGSGKSTLRRALEALLWPEREPSLEVSLRFEWEDEHGPLVVEREGAHVAWTRQGEACEAPPLPSSTLASSFSFGSEDLVAADETARGQARAIAAELAGGFELEPLLRERAIPPGSQRRVHTDWVEARDRVTHVQREQRDLADEERELAALEERLEEASRARAALPRARDALRYAEALASERLAELRLADFPQGMERLAGDELTRLEELAAKRQRLVESRGKATVATRRAESEAEAQRLPPEIDEARLKRSVGQLEEQRRLEERLHEERAQLESLARRRDAAAARAGGVGDPPAFGSREARALQEVLEKDWALGHELLTLEGELAVHGHAERAWMEPEPARRAAHELRAALAGERGAWTGWWAASALAAFLAGLATWAAIRQELLPGSVLAAVLLAIASLLAARMARRPAGRAKILAQLDELGVDAPVTWKRPALEKTLRALDEEVARRESDARQRERRIELEARREELKREAAESQRRRRDTLLECGLDSELSGLALGELSSALLEWRSLHDELERGRAVVEGREQRVRELAGSIDALLRSAEVVGAATSSDYRVELDRLEGRLATLRELRRDAAEARAEDERLGADIAALDEERARLLARLEVAEDELDELGRRVERLDAFREALRSLDKARAVASEIRLRAGLPDSPGDVAALREELATLEQSAEPEHELRDQVARLGARLTTAREGHDLEDALAREEAARAALLDERDAELDGALGALLLRRAGRRHARSSMPARLAHASELLGRFTQQRYALEVSGEVDEARRFVARDNVENRTRPLDQLSSGTRSQLLLAARVAFATAEEGARPLPLFLDETLSQADPERFRAVAQGLLHLAQDGRQVFYLTCQPADAALWRDESARRDDALLDVRDLAELRGIQWRSEIPELEPDEPVLPSPSGLTPQEYALALGVPPLDPFRDVTAAHLFHPLAGQLELLHTLLGASIDHVGQWQAWVEGAADSALLGGAAQAARVEARVKALRIFLEAWRQGRGTPLDREALVRVGITDTFMDAVVSLAEREEWDAARVLEGLRSKEVKRFRSSAIPVIEARMIEHEYLDAREALSSDELRARIFRSLAAELEAGTLPREELSALVERWLAAVSRRAACPR